MLALLRDLRSWCAAEKIAVSDRRWRKVVKLLQVSAWTNGRSRVSIWDAWLLQHCLWEKPEQREKIYEWYAARVGAAAAMDPSRLTKVIASREGQLKRDQESRSQARDAKGELLYRGADGKPTTDKLGTSQRHRGKTPLFHAPARSSDRRDRQGYGFTEITDRSRNNEGYTVEELNELSVISEDRWIGFRQWPDRKTYIADRNNWLTETVDLPPYMEPTRHKEAYVRSSIYEIDQVMGDIEKYEAQLSDHMSSMEREIRDHLWVTADFIEPAEATLKQTAATVVTLVQRMTEVRKGFEMLPQDIGEPRSPSPAPTKSRQK